MTVLEDLLRRVRLSTRLHVAALAYAEFGLYIFPLQPRNKKPLLAGKGFHDATNDVSVVSRWWKDHPEANIGCVPGRSGSLVLDIDGPIGEQQLDELMLSDIATLTATTGRKEGGRHLWFQHPGGSIGNRQLAKHIDVRADAGYVVLPPSVHPSGNRYKWSAMVAIAVAPPHIRMLLTDVVHEGERNNALASHLGSLRASGAGDAELRNAALLFNIRCRPPLSAREVNAVVKSIMRYEQGATSHDALVEEMNERYAIVCVGNNVRIMDTSRDETIFLRQEDFRLLLSSRYVEEGARRVPLMDIWLRSPKRRQYDRIVFEPGVQDTSPSFNWWRGWGVESRMGDCSKFLAHVRDNICEGDENLCQWVLAWFAQIFQDPKKKPGTAIALRGRQGTGKTIVGQVIGKLLGRSYTSVASSHRVTGQFNAHMERCLLLHADEAIWAGDLKSEGVLKNLVTNGVHHIERKGIDSIEVPNYVRLLLTSNSDWVVPAGPEERRFCVIDVGEQRMQDKTYFGELMTQMDNGGYEALLFHLLDLDYSGVDLRTIPQTRALFEQKMATLTPEQAWWLDILDNAVLPGDGDGNGEAPRQAVFENYIRHAQAIGRRRRSSETVVGTFLKKVVPGLRRMTGTVHGKTVSMYSFPDLANCRNAFADITRHPGDWDGPAEWQPDPFVTGDADDDSQTREF